MIKPTIGRVVWFFPHGVGRPDEKRQPNPMLVAFVHEGGELVNLGGFNSNGQPISACSVRLLQEESQYPVVEAFCCWMPYQIGQAAKEKSMGAEKGVVVPAASIEAVSAPAGGPISVADKAAKEAAVAKAALQQTEKPKPVPFPPAGPAKQT